MDKKKVLTKELKEKILRHFFDDTDFREEDYTEPKKILKEKTGKRFTELEHSILTQVMEDEDLIKEIEELTDKQEDKNIFDSI